MSRVGATSRAACTLLLTGALAGGCHNVAEYGSEGGTGVTILDASDLSVVGTVTGFPGGRSVCSLDLTHFLVASNTGLIYTVSSEEMAVEDVREIGTPFSTGYGDMTLAAGGSVYLIGGFGQLIEYNPTTHIVLDEFTAGPSPVCLCRSLTLNRIYIGDSQDMTVREVSTADNTVLRELQLPGPGSPTALSTFGESSGSILSASTDSSAYVIETTGYFGYREVYLSDAGTGISGLPDTSVYCIAQPNWTAEHGTVTLVLGEAVPEQVQVLEMNGHPSSVCCNPEGHEFFVASYLGEGITRVYKIDGFSWDIVSTVDIAGYPWDTAVHSAGSYLLVLTLE